MIILATGSEGEPVHCRGWKIPAETLEHLAAHLAESGTPLEWIWDDKESPAGTRVMVWPDD
jgi:hypothetical protein